MSRSRLATERAAQRTGITGPIAEPDFQTRADHNGYRVRVDAEVRRMTDTERLDWFEKAMMEEHTNTPIYQDGAWGYPYLVNGSPMGGGVGFRRVGNLREAIDAAME
jgi:hypothetical protein